MSRSKPTFTEACCVRPGTQHWVYVADYAKMNKYYAGRRLSNNYRKAGAYEVRKAATGEFTVTSGYSDTCIATVYPDNRVVVGTLYGSTDRATLSHLIALNVHSVSSKYRQNHLRYGGGYRSKGKPLVKGLEFRGGFCLNPERAVDTLRKVKPEVRRAWTKLFAPWLALMRAMVRLTEGPIDKGSWSLPPIEFLTEKEVMAENAMTLISYGLRHGQPSWEDKSNFTKNNKNAVNLVQNHLREAYYEEHDGFVWTPEQ